MLPSAGHTGIDSLFVCERVQKDLNKTGCVEMQQNTQPSSKDEKSIDLHKTKDV